MVLLTVIARRGSTSNLRRRSYKRMQAELKRRNVFHKSHGNSGPGSGRMKSHNYQNYAKVLLHIAEVCVVCVVCVVETTVYWCIRLGVYWYTHSTHTRHPATSSTTLRHILTYQVLTTHCILFSLYVFP